MDPMLAAFETQARFLRNIGELLLPETKNGVLGDNFIIAAYIATAIQGN